MLVCFNLAVAALMAAERWMEKYVMLRVQALQPGLQKYLFWLADITCILRSSTRGRGRLRKNITEPPNNTCVCIYVVHAE